MASIDLLELGLSVRLNVLSSVYLHVASLETHINYCGPRVCSHEENSLLLGPNCKKDCEPIRRHVCYVADEINEVEKKTFCVNVLF